MKLLAGKEGLWLFGVVSEVSVESCLVGVTTDVGMVNCGSCFRTSGQHFFLPAGSGVFCSVCPKASEMPQ